MSTLADDILPALLLLSIFPGSFERRAAAEMLGMTSTALSKTRSLLRILATCSLLQYSSLSERYIMHASVRTCCRSLAQELGLTYESARCTSHICCGMSYDLQFGQGLLHEQAQCRRFLILL